MAAVGRSNDDVERVAHGLGARIWSAASSNQLLEPPSSADQAAETL